VVSQKLDKKGEGKYLVGLKRVWKLAAARKTEKAQYGGKCCENRVVMTGKSRSSGREGCGKGYYTVSQVSIKNKAKTVRKVGR